MGQLTIATFMTLDGITQAPGRPDEDRDGEEPDRREIAQVQGERGEVAGGRFEVLDPDERRTPVAAATPELLEQLLAGRRRVNH